MLPTALGRRRDPAEEQAVHDRRHRVGALVEGVEDDAGPERHDPARDRPGHRAQAVDGPRQEPRGEHQRGERQDPGLHRVVEHRHLDDQAAHPVGRDVGDLERDVRAERRTADDASRRPRWSSSATTCSANAVIE